MEIARDIESARRWRRALGAKTLALAPTMGGLHEGHLLLARRAREAADCVAVSIYVNPLQFGPREDFSSYPRALAADCEKLARENLADLVFAPPDSIFYPRPQQVKIAPPLVDDLCGASRPGFFSGVATAVCKLFHILSPACAVFGRKDLQQLRVVQAMTAQLDFEVDIIECETARAADGLAESSRNNYLSPAERANAPQLFASLRRRRRRLARARLSRRRQNAARARDLRRRESALARGGFCRRLFRIARFANARIAARRRRLARAANVAARGGGAWANAVDRQFVARRNALTRLIDLRV